MMDTYYLHCNFVTCANAVKLHEKELAEIESELETIRRELNYCLQEYREFDAAVFYTKKDYAEKFGKNWKRFISAEELEDFEDAENERGYYFDAVKELKADLKNFLQQKTFAKRDLKNAKIGLKAAKKA